MLTFSNEYKIDLSKLLKTTSALSLITLTLFDKMFELGCVLELEVKTTWTNLSLTFCKVKVKFKIKEFSWLTIFSQFYLKLVLRFVVV